MVQVNIIITNMDFPKITLKRILVQDNYYRRTHLVSRSTCKIRLVTHSTLLTTRSTRSTCFSTRSTRPSIRFFIRGTHLSTSSTRLSTIIIIIIVVVVAVVIIIIIITLFSVDFHITITI